MRSSKFTKFLETLSINTELMECITDGYNAIFESDNIEYDAFVRKTDGKDILYHGGDVYELTDMSFFTDYVGHAYEYGDYVNGIVTGLSKKDVLVFDDTIFNKMRKYYSNISIDDISNMDTYKKVIDMSKLYEDSLEIAYKVMKSSKPYSKISGNHELNDSIIPIMLDYAKKHGYNIIAFWGNDYSDYGGAMEFVVNDVSKYKTLRDMWNEQNLMLSESITSNKNIKLYRGLENEFNPKYDLSKSDAPNGYSTWTDNPILARHYAGENGYVYELEVPKHLIRNEYIDNDGDRNFIYKTGKKAGLNDSEFKDGSHFNQVIKANEYLLYHYHDLFDNNKIKLSGY